MRAIAIDSFGAPAHLHELAVPQPGAREILVRLYAAGVNPYDWKIRDGALKDVLPHEFPLILGFDGAGVVERVGSHVTEFHAGDEVFGLFWPPVLHFGTYAEYLVVPASGTMASMPAQVPGGVAFVFRYQDPAAILTKPRSSDFVHAAALPQPAMMALACLGAAEVATGMTALIVGATGGVGGYAVQIAARRGAHVLATARSADASYIRTLGAAEVLDYTRDDLAAAVRALHPNGIDAVIDVVSDAAGVERVSQALRPGGVLISAVYAADPARAVARGIRAINVILQPTAALLREVVHLVDDLGITVPVERTYPLTRADEALDHIEHQHVRGKTVLTIR
jgi:NADPH:quinone reductase-like Zn-dependent oxidoreductase